MIAELLKRKSPKVKEQKGAAPVSSSSSEDEEEAAGRSDSDEAEAVDFALGDERARYVLFTSDDFDDAPTAKATAAKAPPAAEPSPRKPRAAKVAANSKFKTAASKVKTTTRAAKAFTFPKSFLSTQAINVKHKIGY